MTFWTAPKPGEQAADHVEEPDRDFVERERRGRQRARAHHQRDLVEQQQPAPVEAVGDRAAEEREDDQRRELDRAEQARQERRAGLRVELERQRDERGLGAEPGDEVARDEESQVARLAQRGDVNGEARQAPPRIAGLARQPTCGPDSAERSEAISVTAAVV